MIRELGYNQSFDTFSRFCPSGDILRVLDHFKHLFTDFTIKSLQRFQRQHNECHRNMEFDNHYIVQRLR